MMPYTRKSASLFAVLFGLCMLAIAAPPPVIPTNHHAEDKFIDGYSKMLSEARGKGVVRIIVKLDLEYLESSRISPAATEEYRARIAYKQRQFLNEPPLKDVEYVSLFDSLPYVVMEVDAQQLEAIKSMPIVISIEEDLPGDPLLLRTVQ